MKSRPSYATLKIKILKLYRASILNIKIFWDIRKTAIYFKRFVLNQWKTPQIVINSQWLLPCWNIYGKLNPFHCTVSSSLLLYQNLIAWKDQGQIMSYILSDVQAGLESFPYNMKESMTIKCSNYNFILVYYSF